MQNNMQIWLESSTTTFNLNSHDEGVYLVSDLNGLTSLPSIRTSQGVNAGTDGGWTSAQAFDARLIDVNIVIANEDVSIVESKRRTLNSLLAQSRKETLKLHFISEAGMEYVINVRVTNVTGALTNILKKQELLIQLRADDPIIYGAQGGEGADATLTVQQAIGGFEIPFDIPLIIDGGTDRTNVENLGSEEVYPIIKMTGPLHNPTVVNETQNAEIGVNADLGDMEWRGYESAELLGNTTQETLSGKNKMPMATAVMEGDNERQRNFNMTLPAGTYTISYTLNAFTLGTNTSFSVYMSLFGAGQVQLIDVNLGAINSSTVLGRKSVSFTISADATTDRQANIRIAQSAWNNGARAKLSDIMIEPGSSMTDYEEYVGGIPSPNPDYPQDVNVVSGTQTIKITGKNLAKMQDGDVTTSGITASRSSTTGEVILNNTATATATINASTLYTIPIIEGETYTISANNAEANSSVSIRLNIQGIGSYQNFYLGTANRTITFTSAYTGNCTLQVRVSSGATLNNYIVKPQVEHSATPSAFEVYRVQTITIDLGALELAKIGTYRDRIYENDGEWYKHAEIGKVVFDGTEDWHDVIIPGGGKTIYTPDITDFSRSNNVPFSDYFTGTSNVTGARAVPENNIAFINSGSASYRFYVRYNAFFSDVSAFTTWLASHNTTVYYALATPTETEITDSELIGQLEALLDYAPWYGDGQNVFLIPSAGAQGELVLGAHNEPKPADVVLIDTQLKTVTLNGQNAYPLLKDGSSFFSLAPGDNIMYLTSDVSSDTGKAEIKFKQGFISI